MAMATRDTHQIVIDEADYQRLTEYVRYGESMADGVRRVMKIVGKAMVHDDTEK